MRAWGKSPGLPAQLLGLAPSAPHLMTPRRNGWAGTVGGDPSPFSGEKVLAQGCAGQRWDVGEGKVSGQKFAGLDASPLGDPTRGPSRPPRQPHPAGELGARSIVLARLPLPGPQLMAFGGSARAFHRQAGNAVRARERRPAPG